MKPKNRKLIKFGITIDDSERTETKLKSELFFLYELIVIKKWKKYEDETYFNLDDYQLSRIIGHIVFDIVIKEFQLVEKCKEPKNFIGNYIDYNTNKGYSLRIKEISGLIDLLLLLPDRVNSYYSALSEISKNINKPHPFEQEYWFPLAKDLYKKNRRDRDEYHYTYRHALEDALNNITKECDMPENRLWFNDARNKLKDGPDKLIDRFRKFIPESVLNKNVKERIKKI